MCACICVNCNRKNNSSCDLESPSRDRKRCHHIIHFPANFFFLLSLSSSRCFHSVLVSLAKCRLFCHYELFYFFLFFFSMRNARRWYFVQISCGNNDDDEKLIVFVQLLLKCTFFIRLFRAIRFLLPWKLFWLEMSRTTAKSKWTTKKIAFRVKRANRRRETVFSLFSTAQNKYFIAHYLVENAISLTNHFFRLFFSLTSQVHVIANQSNQKTKRHQKRNDHGRHFQWINWHDWRWVFRFCENILLVLALSLSRSLPHARLHPSIGAMNLR